MIFWNEFLERLIITKKKKKNTSIGKFLISNIYRTWSSLFIFFGYVICDIWFKVITSLNFEQRKFELTGML